MTPETSASIIVAVRGAWSGEVADPARIFTGTVTTSELGGLQPGDEVSVAYQSSGGRVPGAKEHGLYALNARGQVWPLMRFGAHPSTGGTQKDDTRESDWVAEVLPTKAV
ncbi:MAG: hypothetical protein JWQ08_2284 [Deinococcus sp.]|nr:hypothetical protein [Deinococcus sp.]